MRMAISPDGHRIYVTARNSNAVEALDTAKLLADPDHARVGMAPVGEAPVPVAVIVLPLIEADSGFALPLASMVLPVIELPLICPVSRIVAGPR